MPHTLLLADDSVTIQRVIELTFADEDVQVVAVSDGDQAIEQLNANPPDIVLADVGMPGKNGYEVAQYIRQSPRLQHIPIVLLTGAFEPVDQERAAEAGCDGVLAKPFEPQLVIGRVKELLTRSSRKSEPGSASPARAASADLWPAPVANPAAPAARPAAPSAGVPPAPAPATTNNYFDKLDAAFATLTSAPSPAPPLSELPSVAPENAASEIDWFVTQLNPPAATAGATETWDLPGPAARGAADDLPLAAIEAPSVADELSLTESGAEVLRAEVPGAVLGAEVWGATHADAPPAVQHSAPQHSAPHLAPQHQAPQRPVVQRPVALPSIADAFAALLAAEQNEARPAAVPVWPVASAPTSAPAPAVDPVNVDELVERVTRRVLDTLSSTAIRDAVADVTSSIAERLVLEEIERIKSSIK